MIYQFLSRWILKVFELTERRFTVEYSGRMHYSLLNLILSFLRVDMFLRFSRNPFEMGKRPPAAFQKGSVHIRARGRLIERVDKL